MNSSRKLVRDLLIKKRQGKSIQNVKQVDSIPLSPLLTNFEKWSDKRRKLYFEDDISMDTAGLQSFSLDENMFASLLASPMRCERMTRLRAPKDLLLQLKLKKLPDTKGERHSLQLLPSAVHQKGDKSSYIVNSSELIHRNAKSSGSWIPIPALLSSMRYFSVPNVLVDRNSFLEAYQNDICQQLEEELGKVAGRETILEDRSIRVTCDDRSGSPITVQFVKNGEGRSIEVVQLNLASLRHLSRLQQIIESANIRGSGLVLKLPRDEKIVKLLYRLLGCFSFQTIPINHSPL